MRDITQAQMSPVSCWPWSHNWSKWQVIERGKVVKVNQTAPVGSYLLQERTCYECNKKQLRREIATIGGSE
jgi:hypothetical protein